MFLYSVDTVSGTYCASSSITPASTWQQLNCLYTATSSGAVILFQAQNVGAFTTYWDDAAVIPVPPVNPGFESGTLKPWNSNIPNGGTGSITLISSAAHFGNYGLAEGPNSNGESASQFVEGLSIGQTYEVSAWVKLASGTTGQVYLSVDDTSGANTCTTPSELPTSQWQQISCAFKATSTQAMNIRLVETAGSITTYWDDVTVSGSLTPAMWGNFAPANTWINFLGYKW